MTQARPADYWFSNTAIYIHLNAVGDPNYIHANCSAGSMVMCYVRGISDLGYDNAHNYRRWPLIASPTVFHDDERRYVFIAIPKSNAADAKAEVVFPSEIIDLYGRNANNDQVGSTDYFYINTQGIISASRVNGTQCNRTWIHDIDCGKLASDEAIASGGDGTWWEWDAATDMIKFLKTISNADFQQLSATWAKITQLVLGGKTLNGVATTDGDSPTPVNASDVVVTPEYAGKRYLSKSHDDVAAGKISFNNSVFFHDLASLNFVKGASGTAIDSGGNAEVESLTVRSFMQVFELIYNRINAIEGNTSFSDSGTIEFVSPGAGASCTLTIRKRWDGDFTSFQPGDIVYSYVNDISNHSSSTFSRVWGLVKEVDRDANSLLVAMYDPDLCPGGVNGSFAVGMVISRWGNAIEPTEVSSREYFFIHDVGDGRFYNSRQQSFYISCDDGNIVQLMGVNRPVLDQSNYGAVLGQLPKGLLLPQYEKNINLWEPYLYARGIVVQDLIRIDWQGNKLRSSNYRGEWSAATAASSNPYVSNLTYYDTVTYKGMLWQCVATGNVDEPSDHTGSWIRMTDNSDVSKWSILPDADVITVRENVSSPAVLGAAVQRISSDGLRLYNDSFSLHSDGVDLLWSRDGSQWQPFLMGSIQSIETEDGLPIETEDGDGLHISIGGDSILSSSLSDRVSFELRRISDSAVLARISVPVVRDGEKGADGRQGLVAYPAGFFDSLACYSSMGDSTPVVEYDGDFYILKPGVIYCADSVDTSRNNPAKDFTHSDGALYWTLIERFQAVFADYMFARFAKIGSMVVYDDWMISQQGRERLSLNGVSTWVSSTRYQMFTDTPDSPFIPNYMVNFRTGEMRAGNVSINGSMMRFFGNSACNIEIGVNEDGYAVLRYLDNEGNVLYDLGPNGIRNVVDAGVYWDDLWLHRLSSDVSLDPAQAVSDFGYVCRSVPFSNDNHRYRFNSPSVGGMKKYPDIDGRTFVSPSMASERLNGWYCSASSVSSAFTGFDDFLMMGESGDGRALKRSYLYLYIDGVVTHTETIRW